MRDLIPLMVVLRLVAPAAAQTPETAQPEEEAVSEAAPLNTAEEETVTEATTTEEEAPEPFFDILHNERLTGDWWGDRARRLR